MGLISSQHSSRGAKNSKKRAVVAVARKLSVLLHSLWITAENSTSHCETPTALLKARQLKGSIGAEPAKPKKNGRR